MSYTNAEGYTFGLKPEEVIPAILERRKAMEPPIYAYIDEVTYGGNLLGVVEEIGPFRHLEEITDTDEYFPDRYTVGRGSVIPWGIENGRELAIIADLVEENCIGALIDYRVKDRALVWQALNLKKRERLVDFMALYEAQNPTEVLPNEAQS